MCSQIDDEPGPPLKQNAIGLVDDPRVSQLAELAPEPSPVPALLN